MALHLTLHRDALANDDGAAGRWQYEGGKVNEKDKLVGYCAVTRRVTFHGTDAQNTGQLTMTIFFLPHHPPENIPVRGSHDFNAGQPLDLGIDQGAAPRSFSFASALPRSAALAPAPSVVSRAAHARTSRYAAIARSRSPARAYALAR